jgi:hypothetical protein
MKKELMLLIEAKKEGLPLSAAHELFDESLGVASVNEVYKQDLPKLGMEISTENLEQVVSTKLDEVKQSIENIEIPAQEPIVFPSVQRVEVINQVQPDKISIPAVSFPDVQKVEVINHPEMEVEVVKTPVHVHRSGSGSIYRARFGKKFILTDLTLSTPELNDVKVSDDSGVLFSYYFAPRGGAVENLKTPKEIEGSLTISATGKVDVSIDGYLI